MTKFIIFTIVFMTSTVSHAFVIDSADVTIGGQSYGTFIDDTTNLTWLDIDSFWDRYSSYNSITALLSGSGFHLATLAELQTLQTSMPAIQANYTTDALIVGGNYYGNPHPGWDRNLMGGIYDDGDDSGISLSWRWDNTDWLFSADRLAPDHNIFRINGAHQDTGAWIVSDQVLAVPEPSILWLLGIGLGLLGLTKRIVLH